MNFKPLAFFALLLFATGCGYGPVDNHEVITASTPLERLLDGNKHFVAGAAVHPDESIQRIHDLKKGQTPFAIVVCCSDSRVPPELIFDQGLGDLFVVRTAGNVIGDYELGSIEYAVEHLNCKQIIVLGHENCGAVKAYLNDTPELHESHIGKIVDYLSAEAEEKQLPEAEKKNIGLAVRANILHAVHFLKNADPVLLPLVQENKIQIAGAVYSLDNGAISLLNDPVN